MSITAANITVLYLDALTINSVTFAGAVGSEGARFIVETEKLEVKAANALEVVTRFRQGRNARIELPALESVLTLITTVIGDDSSGTDLSIPTYALSATINDADAVAHTLTGQVQFEENLTLELDMKKEAKLPIVAYFVRDSGVLYTLT